MTKGSDFQIWESDHHLWHQEFCFDIFARQGLFDETAYAL
jgi:hypothetical protein